MCEKSAVSSWMGALSPILFPDLANFLRRMLDETKGSGKDQFLSDPDWLSEMQYNTISPLFADFQKRSFPEPFLFVEHAP